MEASDWKAWKQATFGSEHEIWHDGLSVDVVTGRAGAARAEALRMLRLGLALGDDHAALALAAMGDTASVAPITALLARSAGAGRVRVALALYALTSDPALASVLAEVLRGGGSEFERLDAAIGLRRFPRDRVEADLLRAVAEDPDYLPRYHAAESLLAVWGVEPGGIAEHPAVFRELAAKGEPARWAAAAARLAALRDRARE